MPPKPAPTDKPRASVSPLQRRNAARPLAPCDPATEITTTRRNTLKNCVETSQKLHWQRSGDPTLSPPSPLRPTSLQRGFAEKHRNCGVRPPR